MTTARWVSVLGLLLLVTAGWGIGGRPATLGPSVNETQPQRAVVLPARNDAGIAAAAVIADAGVARAVPSPFPTGPSFYETGRVGKMGVSDSGVRIKHTPGRTDSKEIRVDNPSVGEQRTTRPTDAPGVLNQEAFDREVQARFGLLKTCRGEVARHKRIAPASVTASRLTLRWVILPNGRVSDAEVVATAPADDQVMACVKRRILQFSFTPPKGGPARVERPLKFP